MKRVLMVAFHWPPLGGSAAIRNVQTAHTLRAHGWDPVVVHGGIWRGYPTDASLRSDVEAVEATAPFLPPGWFFPDEQVGWIPAAVGSGLHALHRGARVIWTTSPPASAHVIGWILKRVTGRPWVMDYNVEWATNPAVRWRSEGQQRRHRRLEAFLLRRADAVCSLSARHLERLPVPVRSLVVEAGYDPRRFHPTPRRSLKLDRPFVITHTGSLFGVQRPDAFVRAVNALVEQGALAPDRIIARFVGNLWEGAASLRDARFRVETRSLVPYAEVPALIADSDALLVTLAPEAECVVPNKVYEYMAAGRPILAIVPRANPVTALVEGTCSGVAVDPSDEPAVRAAILSLVQGRFDYAPDARAVASYELGPTIGKLAALLNELAA
jgi:glycosyltransferase involved in cell wall biosynthesis